MKEFSVGGLSISSNQILVFVVTGLLLFGLQMIVLKTKMGTAMRAVSFNPQAASLVGINNDVIISFTFGLGSALAAVGGILYSMNYRSIDLTWEFSRLEGFRRCGSGRYWKYSRSCARAEFCFGPY